MMRGLGLFLRFSLLLFLLESCDPPIEIHGTDTVLYPFSAVGLVRDNPTDTIDVWYANATAQKGVNEVVHKVITKDTIVGLNNTWFTYQYGKWGSMKFFPSIDYSDKGTQYFKICNRGKSNVFYFIVPPPDLPKLIYQEVDYKIAIRYQDKTIYDMLFKDGKYTGVNLKEIADLYKKHDVDNQTLFLLKTDKATQKKEETPLLRVHGDSMGPVEKGVGFYYGTIYSNECIKTYKELSRVFFLYLDI